MEARVYLGEGRSPSFVSALFGVDVKMRSEVQG